MSKPKIIKYNSGNRFHHDHGWLKAFHSFSFGDYYDPNNMGFSVLRVINEDFIAGGAGFPMHGHKDMEIITYVIDGELAHKDTLGTSATIKPGEVQRMSTGTGIRHSEFNALTDKETHLLQIWIEPDKNGHSPSYEQKNFNQQIQSQALTLVATRGGSETAMHLNQDLFLYVGKMHAGQKIQHVLKMSNVWIQMVRGLLHGTAGASSFSAGVGDGIAIVGSKSVSLEAKEDCEFLLFELP